MNEPHPYANLFGRIVRAPNDGDLATITALVSEDFTYRVPGRSLLAGVYGGRSALNDYLAGALTTTVMAPAGDYLLMRTHVTAERGGRHLDSTNVMTFRFVDGLLVEGENIPADLYTWDQFWSSEEG